MNPAFSEQQAVICQIPAKLMLFGEYSVLQGGRAVALTLGLTMQTKVRKRRDKGLCIYSDLWKKEIQAPTAGDFLALGTPEAASSLGQTAVNACRYFSADGFDIRVRSGWDVKDGLGSSSALRLGVWFGIAKASGHDLIPTYCQDLLLRIWHDQKEYQGFGSGYDLATQFTGGLVLFQLSEKNQSWDRRPLAVNGSLREFVHIYRGGMGAPTGPTGKAHMAWLRQQGREEEWQTLQEAGVRAVIRLSENPDKGEILPDLILAVDSVRRMWEQSPVFPGRISALLAPLPGLGKSWSYKTTGAGGEDAIILVGLPHAVRAAHEALGEAGWRQIDAAYPGPGLSFREE